MPIALGEFDLIKRYFSRASLHKDIVKSVGDDCALLSIPSDKQLAITTDTLVENVHFFSDVSPERLGHKALAVNLSDLAAMGADPRCVSLALTLPHVSSDWLDLFAQGFWALAQQFDVDLVGGDTTSGPLSISVTAMGYVTPGNALMRGGAGVGDNILVTGEIGSAGFGLRALRDGYSVTDDICVRCLEMPEPRVEAGRILRNKASSCIDISDGLFADLKHLLTQSSVNNKKHLSLGAQLDHVLIPHHADVSRFICSGGAHQDSLKPLTWGDDYELCATVPDSHIDIVMAELAQSGHNAAVIGKIDDSGEIKIKKISGEVVLVEAEGGYQHF